METLRPGPSGETIDTPRHRALGSASRTAILRLVRAELQLGVLTGSLGRVSSLVPLLLAAPSYFEGLITLGLIVQTRVAYDQVSGALAWFVNAYREIARWRANVERLAGFLDAMDATDAEPGPGPAALLPSLAGSFPFGAGAISRMPLLNVITSVRFACASRAICTASACGWPPGVSV